MEDLIALMDQLKITKPEIAAEAKVSLRMIYLWLDEPRPNQRLLTAVRAIAFRRVLAGQACHKLASDLLVQAEAQRKEMMTAALEMVESTND